MPRGRTLALLVVVVALVAWITADASGRATSARAEHARRALALAERQVYDALASPDGWAPLWDRWVRHPFGAATDHTRALATARDELAWAAAREATSGASIIERGGQAWLVQRRGQEARALPWDPIARSIARETGVALDLQGARGAPFMPGLLRSGSGPVTARTPDGGGLLAPLLDVGRALLAIVAAGLLVREMLLVQHAREREQAREAVLQRISHELRTPAASIRSLSDALAAGAVEDPEEQRQFFGLLGTEAQRLAVGIDRLLRAARGEGTVPVAPVPVDLVEWTRTLSERWRSRIPALRVEAPDSLVARADPERLDEAVEALLDNARKYGGPAVVLAVARAGDAVRISVRDDGPGVPEHARARIFDRLQRVEGRDGDPGGYGLGLWAAAEVARAHGGALTLEGGSCFVLTLPEAR